MFYELFHLAIIAGLISSFAFTLQETLVCKSTESLILCDCNLFSATLADGRHDGYHNGKRYFVCRHKHGLFIPLEDVLCILDGRLQVGPGL